MLKGKESINWIIHVQSVNDTSVTHVLFYVQVHVCAGTHTHVLFYVQVRIGMHTHTHILQVCTGCASRHLSTNVES